MKTIGIRAEPKAVTFVIYDSDEQAVVNVEEIKIPAAFSWPEALKYVRHSILDILREYEVEKAGIRVTEASAKSGPSIERVQIEGVVQETFASSSVDAYYVGQISNISSRAEIPRDDFKRYVSGELEFDVENWDGMSSNAREALICAMGAVNA